MNIKCFVKGAAWFLGAFLTTAASLAGAQPLIKVTLRTDYKVNGYVGAFALARERGFYREQGLDVEIGQGQGSSTTVQTVASGGDTFGLADSIALVNGISNRNVPVKALMVFSQTGIQGFAFHRSSGWDGNVKNLRNKVLIGSPGSAELSILPAVLATAGMTMNDIKLQLVDPNAKIPLFLQEPNALAGGYATGDILRIKKRMPDVGYVPFSNYGIVAYGTAVITNSALIQSDPALVRKFMVASSKGWETTVNNIEAAVQAAHKLFPDADPEQMREGLKILVETQLHTPATRGKPVGWMAESDWKAMVQLLQKDAKSPPKPLSAYYTNEFIPQR